jgi:hypothetical protein
VAATESRAAILAGGEVLEAVFDWRTGGCAPRLEVVEELSGLGVERLVGARGNRFAVVTGAGEGYVLEDGNGGSGEVRRVELPGEGDGDVGEEEASEGGEQEAVGRPEEDGGETDDDEDGDDSDDDDDAGITDLALGPDYEIVISAGAVWARGNSSSWYDER